MRRAKLYYLRGLRGKAARIPERQEVRTGKKGADAFKGFTKPKGEPDDLKLIAGVTPELEKKLNKLGLIKFEQIANLTDDEIARLDEELKLNGAIENDDWVAKSVELMAETTADEVPAEEEDETEGEEAETEAKAGKGAQGQRGQARQKAQEGLRLQSGSMACHARESGHPVATDVALPLLAVVAGSPGQGRAMTRSSLGGL